MTNNEATFATLMEELEAEFADLEELLGENGEEVAEQAAATTVIDLLEQASAVVNEVRGASDSGNDNDETARQAIEDRLASVENSLSGIDAQLAGTRQELVALRQLLASV